jgi:hypothetical protein
VHPGWQLYDLLDQPVVTQDKQKQRLSPRVSAEPARQAGAKKYSM